MQGKSLKEIENEYMLGLNYIENSNNAKSLRSLYIERLKEIREELTKTTVKEEKKSSKK